MRGTCEIASILRPRRPELARCLGARDAHIGARAESDQALGHEIRACIRRIESLRAEVFAAGDGVVPAGMTELEREWRRLARLQADAGWMDLWAAMAPAAWIDRKRWRDAPTGERLDLAVALAADPEGVEAAEAAVERLRAALAPLGTALPPRVRWRFLHGDVEDTRWLLGAARAEAEAEAARVGAEAVADGRARAREADVARSLSGSLDERPTLVGTIAEAAGVDYLRRAAGLGAPDPVEPLRAIWSAGYVISAVDAGAITLGAPAL